MTIDSVKWQAHLSRSGSQPDGASTAEEYFIIQCDGDTDSTAVQGAADPRTGMTAPTYGRPHPTSGVMYCNTTEYTPAEQNTRRVFQCRAMYTDQFEQEPLTAPPDIQWDFSEAGERPYFIDCTPAGTAGPNGQNGPQPMVNTARDQFQDFLTRATGDVVATFSKNLTPNAAAALSATIIPYLYPVPAINSGGITFDGQTIAAYKARLKGARIGGLQRQVVYGSVVQYRTVTYTLAFRNDWRLTIDDRGTRFLNGSGMLQDVPKLSVNPGADLSTTLGWPLDGHGHMKPNVTDAPAQLTFYPYPPMAFSPFAFT